MELFAHFFADAAEVVRVEQDFGWIEFFADDGKVLGDAGGAGFFGGFLVSGDFSRRSWVCGIGSGGFFCEVASEHEFELGGIDLLAGCAEDLAAKGVDGLFEDNDLGSLARDDLVALCDLV